MKRWLRGSIEIGIAGGAVLCGSAILVQLGVLDPAHTAVAFGQPYPTITTPAPTIGVPGLIACVFLLAAIGLSRLRRTRGRTDLAR